MSSTFNNTVYFSVKDQVGKSPHILLPIFPRDERPTRIENTLAPQIIGRTGRRDYTKGPIGDSTKGK